MDFLEKAVAKAKARKVEVITPETPPETSTFGTNQTTSKSKEDIPLQDDSKGEVFGGGFVEAPEVVNETPITPVVMVKDTSKKEFPLSIVEISNSDPLLAKLDATEQYRILGEINKLKFAVKSVLEKGTDYYGRLPTRSGVHKLQTIFNISTEIVDEKYWKDEEGNWVAKYKVRAISPDGRYTEAMGLCEQLEKGRVRTMMDTLATAQTRATNRAILDLVGFGQVSAEEIDDKEGDAFGGS